MKLKIMCEYQETNKYGIDYCKYDGGCKFKLEDRIEVRMFSAIYENKCKEFLYNVCILEKEMDKRFGRLKNMNAE